MIVNFELNKKNTFDVCSRSVSFYRHYFNCVHHWNERISRSSFDSNAIRAEIAMLWREYQAKWMKIWFVANLQNRISSNEIEQNLEREKKTNRRKNAAEMFIYRRVRSIQPLERLIQVISSYFWWEWQRFCMNGAWAGIKSKTNVEQFRTKGKNRPAGGGVK